MSTDDANDLGAASQAFLDHLDKTGFFQQINELEKNLKSIAEDLKVLGDATIQRMEETESLVAHVLAIESILVVALRSNAVDAEAVRQVVKEKTSQASGNAEGSPKVHAVVDELLSRAGG